jgi:acyl carrier protein
MNSVLTELQEMMRQTFSFSAEQVRPENKLKNLDIDSLSIIEFIYDLELKFDVSLAERRDQLETIGDIARIISLAMTEKDASA